MTMDYQKLTEAGHSEQWKRDVDATLLTQDELWALRVAVYNRIDILDLRLTQLAELVSAEDHFAVDELRQELGQLKRIQSKLRSIYYPVRD